jgi:FKBP-type peptidyl-prolyl cis-trans isomerase
MKKSLTTLATTLLLAPLFAATPLKTPADQVSYTIGYQLGQNLTAQDVEIHQGAFDAGLSAALSKQTPELTPAQMQAVMKAFQTQMMQKMVAKQKAIATENQKASDAFMAKIAKEPGIKMIEPGLYYTVQTEGKGSTPKATDSVVVNYSGSLINGKVFDSSYARKKPATFQVNQVIPGWTAALEHMPVGSKWTVYIAPNLAYGQYAPPVIGPNQALIFTIELMSIEPAATSAGTANAKA